jgi:hypothetical protein
MNIDMWILKAVFILNRPDPVGRPGALFIAFPKTSVYVKTILD